MMVRVDGIEPTTSAWKADVLPLNYTRDIETRTMPAPPPVGQDRNAGNSAFFTPHRPFLNRLPQHPSSGISSFINFSSIKS